MLSTHIRKGLYTSLSPSYLSDHSFSLWPGKIWRRMYEMSASDSCIILFIIL